MRHAGKMRLDAWLAGAARRLAEAGIDSTRLEAQVLASHGMGKDRAWVLAHPEAEAPPDLDALLDRRAAREPLAYIVGYREFRGLRFAVGPQVLIPRQETEVLVELAADLAPRGGRALDIGTGCGCIAISLAVERPDLVVTGSDVSREALAVAMANGEALGAVATWRHADGVREGAFDLIVSNPPYVAPDSALPPEIALHEPALAVYGTDTDGLGFYRRIAREAMGAAEVVAVETGFGQECAVRAIFEEAGWRHVETRADLSGIPRAIAFRS
jgi:release factor glutamine methyltransferase